MNSTCTLCSRNPKKLFPVLRLLCREFKTLWGLKQFVLPVVSMSVVWLNFIAVWLLAIEANRIYKRLKDHTNQLFSLIDSKAYTTLSPSKTSVFHSNLLAQN